MIPRLVDARHVSNYTLRIRFDDGTEGEVNLSGELEGEVFSPLRDVAFFLKFEIHPEFHTLAWPNGADFAPEFLYERVRITAG